MQSPEVNSLEVFGPVGAGACGRVYRARDSSGAQVAVKIFDPAAVNRALLEEMALRAEEPAWPAGLLPELSADYRGKQIVRITKFLGDEIQGVWIPRSLQHRLDRFPGENSWPVVLELLRALTALHERQVAHANLKPGNIFFDDADRLVLTDWALGNVPGIESLDYTDAILYQPPDQLRAPDGYLRERGYRWDVFAFGVISFRVLTGAFPRCTKVFDSVAPESGKTRRDGIAANFRSIAKSLETEPLVKWSDVAANPLEEAYRGILERCLSLDPEQRPANAGAVLALFHAADKELAAEQQRDAVLDQHRRARRSAGRANVAAGILAGTVAILSVLYHMKRSEISAEETGRKGDVSNMEGLLDKSEQARSALESELGVIKEASENERRNLQYDRDRWLARLEKSREIGDHLFAWAMEKGHRHLPPLDGRERRLKRLEDYFQDFIIKTAEIPELKEERARARLQLAEVSLAKGEPKEAAQRLEEALTATPDLPSGPDLDLRLATDRLLLALLLQERNDDGAGPAFKIARKALEAIPQAAVDADRVQELLAILDFHESRILAANGKDAEAADGLIRATEVLKRLSIQRPDATILQSELATCFLSSATILDGIGLMGDARDTRTKAAEILVNMLRENPADLDIRVDLAGCYGEIAAAALLAGDVAGTETSSRQAVKLLEEVKTQRPEDPDVRSLLAAQRWITARIVRDRGDAVEALRLTDDGIQMIEGIAVNEAGDPVARYRLALLFWQKGLLLATANRQEQAIDYQTRSAEMLRKLVGSDYGLVRSEQIRRSLGYVLGDLGHAARLAKKPELAQAAFGEAVAVWSILNRERPQNEEYEECLVWSQQRLKGP
ncbi:hypothetical protein [Haloferula sp. BvORR071]|uniref:protein kinase domain-containing protein n=1 Tax=Haloferula sp. BvORR071 TaxID=1396141 RepID=UPI0005500F38|nr:hypothetical protein [Haloferula sp. BvORR071]